ncbi:MAG: hypothetical protein VXA26_07315 [Candidatus Neomarinimicrobiota bacterium]
MKYLYLPVILITLASCGGGGGGGSDSYSPQGSGGTPQPTNTAPTINNASNSYSVLENQTSAFSVDASDPEGDSLTYSLSGDDASLFLITSSGTVRFVSAPDFENPQASAGGNAYSLTVSVSDGALTDSKDFTVTVTNDSSDDGPAGPEILGTRVIDGYISGANVFVDFNWNLVQDEGEPSATENEQDETYSFEAVDFSSINDFTEECARARPRIASIPVGAVDADRGVVDAAYELYFFPWYGNVAEDTSSANITPLTSLFTSYLSNQLDSGLESGISVADGCADTANSIGTEIESRVAEVMISLEQSFDIDPATFYDDFIASGNEKLQNFGEVVANYLQLTYGVSLLLEQEYGVKMRTQIDQLLLESLLADTIPEVFEFALFSETPEVTLDDNWTAATLYAVYDIYGNQDGELLTGTDPDDITFELSLENLIEYTDFVARERMFDPGYFAPGNPVPLFGDNQVLLESGTERQRGEYRFIDIGTFLQDDCLIRYQESDKILGVSNDTTPPSKQHYLTSCLGGFPVGGARIELYVKNPANPERVNMDEAFTQRNTQTFIDIYDGIIGLAKTVDTMSGNDNLLIDGDYQVLTIEGWEYRRSNVNGLIEEICTDTTNNIIYNDAEAYQECSENMPMENVAPPGGGEAPGGNSVTIEVSVEPNNNGAGNVYVIDGVQKNTLNFVHGTTYTLNHPNGHPLRFSTTADGTHGGGVEYTDQVNTATDGSTVIEVTAGTPAILYYYCSIHEGMGGSINVTEN